MKTLKETFPKSHSKQSPKQLGFDSGSYIEFKNKKTNTYKVVSNKKIIYAYFGAITNLRFSVYR